MSEYDEFLERARRELFPKIRGSALALVLVNAHGDPDPKLCVELGAAILLDKPIVAILPRGRRLPLALRAIAHQVVEDCDVADPASAARLQAAISKVLDSLPFRPEGGRDGHAG